MKANYWYILKTPCFRNRNSISWHVTIRIHGPPSKIQTKSSFNAGASQRKHNWLQRGCHKCIRNEVCNLRIWKIRENHKQFFIFQEARYSF